MSLKLEKIRRAFGGIAPRVLDAELRIQSPTTQARVSALLVESEDAHGSEYVSERDMRRAFVSGFDGSAGTALVTNDKALLWTDGRYFLQAENQLSKDWTLMRQAQKGVPTIEEWLELNLTSGEALAIDPLLTSVATARRLVQSATKAHASVVCCEWGKNVVDQIWEDQPPKLPSNLRVLGDDFTGASIANKLDNLREEIVKKGAHATVLTALDDIAWLFNIRGSDVEFNPVVMSYALVTLHEAILFVDAADLTPEVKAHFGQHVQVRGYNDIIASLEAYAKDSHGAILVDPSQCNVAVFSAIPLSIRKEAPSILLRQKAIKNAVEIEGMRQAHIRDGAALVKFWSWLEETIEAGIPVNEVSADKKQQSFRKEMEHFVSLSFGTISGSGPNGAIIHYHADDEATCGTITKDKMYLNDSGAQYLDGTTDITRTVHFGQPTAHEIHCFTHVLKSHIALATAVFPNECDGVKLDAITRAPMWKAGLDYRHGTGHGVGAFLNVHEKGVLMSFKLNPTGLLISENMIVSNEPGYYEDGAFGIRIENLMVAVKATNVPQNFGPFCTFETITFVPIQRELIDVSLLTTDELAWLNTYHDQVRSKLSPLLQNNPSALAYLVRETITCVLSLYFATSSNRLDSFIETMKCRKILRFERSLGDGQWNKSHQKITMTKGGLLQEPLLASEMVYLDDSESDFDTTFHDDDDLQDNEHVIILARLKPTGRVTTDGLASKYSDSITAPLTRVMTENEFRAAIGAINQTLNDYFPCLCCVVYAYMGYIVTCGLVLCCARPCTTEAEDNVRRVLKRINRKDIFHDKGIRWKLERTRCTSWIEISHNPQQDIRRMKNMNPDSRRMSVPISPEHRRVSLTRPPTPVGDRRLSAPS